MSTATKSDNTSTTIDNKTNNKALFGPLGKYAIAGVIMVSIMITTIIMLNKQHNTAAENIASIEKGLADSNANESTAATASTSAVNSENKQIQDPIEVAEVEVTPVKVKAAVQAAEETTHTVTTTEETVSDTGQNTEQASTTAQATTQTATTESAKTDTVVKNTANTALPQLVADNRDQQWQARIQAHKLEQKQRMSEHFTRIKSFESEHLEQFKVHQDEQIEHLREQIVRQQEMIEELILRNKESYEMREASMQRHQTSREEMLNRI